MTKVEIYRYLKKLADETDIFSFEMKPAIQNLCEKEIARLTAPHRGLRGDTQKKAVRKEFAKKCYRLLSSFVDKRGTVKNLRDVWGYNVQPFDILHGLQYLIDDGIVKKWKPAPKEQTIYIVVGDISQLT